MKWRRKFVGAFATLFLGAIAPGCGSSATPQAADEWQDTESVQGELVVGQEPSQGGSQAMVAPDVSAVGKVLSSNAHLGITRVKLGEAR